MKRSTIDALRETRLWLSQIVKPVGEGLLGVGLIARELRDVDIFKKSTKEVPVKSKVIDLSAFERTEPVRREPKLTDEALRYLDAAARMKHLEQKGKDIL